ncbi:MAG: glycosyltransferase family 4 protein [Chloroflexi bacterium]|nr:glycosyltransferase family 4 protein [Chloroflexota bacterium]
MAVTKDRYRVVFVAPTAFFYQAPIFRELAAHPRIDLMVYFCSDEAIRGEDVRKKFQTDNQWGDNEKTLKGYKHKFLKNYSPFASYLSWPFGLMNFGIWSELRKAKPDAIVIMSWVNVTDLVTISASQIIRSPLLLMTDANIQAETQKSRWVIWIKNLVLKNFVFKITAGFLYTGTANKLLYQSYGVPDEKLVPFAFSWEAKDFLQEADRLRPQRTQMRTDMGISENSFVTLFCGRLSPEKAPLHLLEAFERVESPGKELVFVGDGKLKNELESFVVQRGIKSVRFLGFQARSEIGRFYAIADALVLPSSREATGAVITEAMSFGLPVIVSDKVGFGMDLVKHGSNGYIFPVGDTVALTGYITDLMEAPEEKKTQMSLRSREIVEEWSKLDLAGSLLEHLDYLYAAKGEHG